MDSYNALQGLAQSSGLLYFVALFAAVLIYVLRPRNKKTFEAAALMPLKDEEQIQ